MLDSDHTLSPRSSVQARGVSSAAGFSHQAPATPRLFFLYPLCPIQVIIRRLSRCVRSGISEKSEVFAIWRITCSSDSVFQRCKTLTAFTQAKVVQLLHWNCCKDPWVFTMWWQILRHSHSMSSFEMTLLYITCVYLFHVLCRPASSSAVLLLAALISFTWLDGPAQGPLGKTPMWEFMCGNLKII